MQRGNQKEKGIRGIQKGLDAFGETVLKKEENLCSHPKHRAPHPLRVYTLDSFSIILTIEFRSDVDSRRSRSPRGTMPPNYTNVIRNARNFSKLWVVLRYYFIPSVKLTLDVHTVLKRAPRPSSLGLSILSQKVLTGQRSQGRIKKNSIKFKRVS